MFSTCLCSTMNIFEYHNCDIPSCLVSCVDFKTMVPAISFKVNGCFSVYSWSKSGNAESLYLAKFQKPF